MRRFGLAMILLCVLLLVASPALATESTAVPEMLAEQLAALDTAGVEAFLAELNRTGADYLPPLTLQSVVGFFRGQGEIPGIREIINGSCQYLFREVLGSAHLLGKILILAVVAAVLGKLQEAFGGENTARLALVVIYLVLVALALTSFSVAVATASAVVDSLVTFMVALLPLLIPLVAATGAVVTAGLFSPLMIFATQATGMVVKEFVLPLIFCGAILELVSRVWEGVSVSSLAALLRQAGLTLLGFFFSVFLGVMAVQGAAGAIADGVTVRTAKFLSGTFIPVVGGMFADAVEVVIGSALILKNAVGLLGVLAIFLTILFPLLKLLAVVLVYRVGAALVQPLGAAAVGDCLQVIANTLTLFLVATAAVGLMFLITVTVIIGAGNVAVMLR